MGLWYHSKNNASYFTFSCNKHCTSTISAHFRSFNIFQITPMCERNDNKIFLYIYAMIFFLKIHAVVYMTLSTKNLCMILCKHLKKNLFLNLLFNLFKVWKTHFFCKNTKSLRCWIHLYLKENGRCITTLRSKQDK